MLLKQSEINHRKKYELNRHCIKKLVPIKITKKMNKISNIVGGKSQYLDNTG